MESVKFKPGRKDSGAQSGERLSLRKEEHDRLEGWVQELNLKFDGMIRLTKSDLANFLIRHHPPNLSIEELGAIEAEHFDEVRWLNWATNKIREAKKCGQILTLMELLEARNHPSPPVTQTKKTRGRKLKINNKDESILLAEIEKRDASEPASVKDLDMVSSLKNNQNS